MGERTDMAITMDWEGGKTTGWIIWAENYIRDLRKSVNTAVKNNDIQGK